MKKEFNFRGAKRGSRAKPEEAKVLITFRIDASILSWLRLEADKKGLPYQTFMNSVLKKAMDQPSESEEFIRRIVRDEISKK